jgi:phosphate butyryltransferase
MSLLSFEQLYQEADALPEPVPVAVAGGADGTVLEALRTACDRGWVTPVVAGREADVRRTAAEYGQGLHGFTLLDAEEPAAAAVGAVRSGLARLLMKGQIATPALMAAILDPANGLRRGRVICQVVLMEVRPAGRRFLLADTGICTYPTLDERIDIMRHAVEAAHALGAEVPRVAVLSATETVNRKLPDTLEAADLQHRSAAGEFRGCVVQGPLSFDLAYAADAADRKRVGGPVVGAADVMLFPNLLAANLTVKAIMYTADCRFGGVLCGAACPVVFMSRADSTATRLNSLALALKLTQASRAEREGDQ